MGNGRCIGLIGGLGVGAAIHYYGKLVETHEEQGFRLNLVMAHAEASQVYQFVQSGDRSGLADYLAGFIEQTAAAGAELAVIPAVTPHFCIKELTSASPLPLLNIFDPLIEELARRSIRRVAMFGTRFVMESKLFGMVSKVDFIPARADEAEYIHNTYTALVQRRQGSPEQYSGLTSLAQTLCKRDGADAIILAGTDLALLFNESNTDFPAVDCAALHLRAITQVATGE